MRLAALCTMVVLVSDSNRGHSRMIRTSSVRPSRDLGAVLAGSLLALVATGCSFDSPRWEPGVARVRFDGSTLGQGYPAGLGGSYPRVGCSRDEDLGAATLLEPREVWYSSGDWQVRRGNAAASMRLEMSPGDLSATVEFTIGPGVYRSETVAVMEPGWSDGRVVFRDVPLVAGEPYRKKSQLDRLVIEWQCDEYEPRD